MRLAVVLNSLAYFVMIFRATITFTVEMVLVVSTQWLVQLGLNLKIAIIDTSNLSS